jgi:hypothetical protein
MQVGETQQQVFARAGKHVVVLMGCRYDGWLENLGRVLQEKSQQGTGP